MPRRPAPKRIQYVRATFPAGAAPQQSLEFLVRSAIRALGSVGATQVGMGMLGTVAIRQRSLGTPLMLAIGAGARNEYMSTLGLDVGAAEDDDQPEPPPPQRAFKLADAFILLEENDLLVVLDGGFTTGSAAAYLRELVDMGNQGGRAFPVFELRPVTNRDCAAVLAREGIKELHIDSTLHAATAFLDQGGIAPKTAWARFTGTLRAFVEESQDDNDAQLLAEEWDDLQVSTVISAKGGSRAKEAVLESVEALGEELLEDVPPGVKLKIVTRNNTEIRQDELIRVKSANLKRRENTNDLDVTEVWEKLTEYRQQLQDIGEWRR